MAGNPRAMCHCHTCNRIISSMGIARHRTMHKEKKELCVIEYSTGTIYRYDFSKEATHDK